MLKISSNSSVSLNPILVLIEIFISNASKISVRKSSNTSGSRRNPEPFCLATTVLDGQPRFKLTSSYPSSFNSFAVLIKSSELFVKICGTICNPSLCSGNTSWNSLVLKVLFPFGMINGV